MNQSNFHSTSLYPNTLNRWYGYFLCICYVDYIFFKIKTHNIIKTDKQTVEIEE
jgi:Ca2+/Na+ antiporter